MRLFCKLCLLFILFAWTGTVRAALAEEHAPTLPAKAYLLMDGASGQVLVDYAGQTRLPIASTTKIMTAILALERGRLTDVVTAGLKPFGRERLRAMRERRRF